MSDINEMNVGPRWYVAHTYSGYENKVKTSLEKIVENRGLEDLIYDIKIPVQIIIEKKGDQEIEVEEKLFPGYVYIKMTMLTLGLLSQKKQTTQSTRLKSLTLPTTNMTY